MKNLSGKTLNGIKTATLSNGNRLFFWYANNRGRGGNNVTIAYCPANAVRAYQAAKQQHVIAITRTSGWRGNVNLSQIVLARLGIADVDIIGVND